MLLYWYCDYFFTFLSYINKMQRCHLSNAATSAESVSVSYNTLITDLNLVPLSQRPSGILIFGTFAKFSFFFNCGQCFIINHLFWDPTSVYDVTVTSYVKCSDLFKYVWQEETHSYTLVSIRRIWEFSFQNHKGW